MRQPREHSVPCSYCRRPTFRVDATCDACEPTQIRTCEACNTPDVECRYVQSDGVDLWAGRCCAPAWFPPAPDVSVEGDMRGDAEQRAWDRHVEARERRAEWVA